MNGTPSVVFISRIWLGLFFINPVGSCSISAVIQH
jgi:hypothetical protein